MRLVLIQRTNDSTTISNRAMEESQAIMPRSRQPRVDVPDEQAPQQQHASIATTCVAQNNDSLLTMNSMDTAGKPDVSIRGHINSSDVSNYNCNTSEIKKNILPMPTEILSAIFQFVPLERECQMLEWIGILSGTCRLFRGIAQGLAPTSINLKEYKNYVSISRRQSFDAHVGILEAMNMSNWMRANLVEFHVNSVTLDNAEYNASILPILCSILRTPESLPKVKWLDINLAENYRTKHYVMIDRETLLSIPAAVPSLQKLCLGANIDQVGPISIKKFFSAFRIPLKSLSLCTRGSVLDQHIDTFMPLIGKDLKRLELIGGGYRLTDLSLFTIAKYCNNLESFAIVDSSITAAGIEAVLSANTNITTLNLSGNRMLDVETISVISRLLPKLKILRAYGYNFDSTFFNDDTLKALIDAQEEASCDSSISLERIGLHHGNLTIAGIEYAISKGVKEIEINEFILSNMYSGVGHFAGGYLNGCAHGDD